MFANREEEMEKLQEIRVRQRLLQRAAFVARRGVVSCETNKGREMGERCRCKNMPEGDAPAEKV